MNRLYDALKDCKKEEEVKAEFCKSFYKEICNTHWMNFKIENWDVGLWQIKQANLGIEELNNLKSVHKELSKKLLPKIYK